MDQIILVTDINETTATPPGGGGETPSYYAWEFEDNNWHEYNNTANASLSGTGTLLPGKIGNRVQDPNLSVSGDFVKDNLFLDWSTNWAVSFWNLSSSSGQIRIDVNENGTSTRQWGIWVVGNNGTTRFYTPTSNLSLASNVLNSFIWVIHDTALDDHSDPINPIYKLRFGANNNAGTLISTTSVLSLPANPPNPTLIISDFNTGGIDQLVIWKELKTAQDMHDLYNDGNGLPLN